MQDPAGNPLSHDPYAATGRFPKKLTPAPPSGQATPATLPRSAEVPLPDAVPQGTQPANGEADFNIGRVVGPYQIMHLLARGGMGAVYYAEDVQLRRAVALKLMIRDLANDHDALKRFEREARAAAAIQHPNIATIYMVGRAQDDGAPFLAMEYIDGGSLLQLIRTRENITFSMAAGYMTEAAEGLKAARRLGVIHRDIKPGNIMITGAGQVKLVDFGLAKVLFDDSYKTVEGMVLGTPKYMSPEQGQGRQLDHRSDIYSLGATFYHLLTGRPPFDAETSVQIMMKHVTAPLVPMRTLNPAVPLEFDAIIGRCMRKELDARYQDYDELISDLKAMKLQALAHERGPILNAAGQANLTPLASSSQPGRAASVASIPQLTDPTFRAPTVTSVRPLSTSGSQAELPPISPLAGLPSWTAPALIGLVSLAIVVGVGLAVISSIGGSKPAEEPAAQVEDPSADRPPLAIMLDRIAREGGSARRGSGPPSRDYLAWRATREILSTLGARNSLHHAEKGRWVSRLSELTAPELGAAMPTDDVGHPIDGWQRQLLYDARRGVIRSPGMDGFINNADDMTATGSDVEDGQGGPYERLHQEELMRRR